jgi:hypothetical protein
LWVCPDYPKREHLPFMHFSMLERLAKTNTLAYFVSPLAKKKFFCNIVTCSQCYETFLPANYGFS